MTAWEPGLGAVAQGGATRFRVWAPEVERVEVVLEAGGRETPLVRGRDGYHENVLPGVKAGELYRYRLDGRGPYPDPASRFQPQGVHGPSQIVDWRHFAWTDGEWNGLALEDAVFYELHVGAFTPEGDFAAVAARLEYLRDLGVTAIELMPVADFPGRWNWGYDGVAPFAPARCYGSPDDLRSLVDRAHALGLAVCLDVVYNHLGPDGAYQSAFSPYYYSKTHTTAWGASINFDGLLSEPVRDYFIENALHWIHEYHIDGLRLDATHTIVDDGPRHILASLNAAVKTSLVGSARRVCIVAEDERNLACLLKPEPDGGLGFDGVWADDFHHQTRRLLAGDCEGYFADFDGAVGSIAATARRGWFYTGQDAPYFGGPRGTDTAGIALSRFVICLQNHDQIGNRAFGDRLHHQIEQAAWRAASTLLLMLPETPILFMGQEFAATAPFRFFTDHRPELGALVTQGRRREFSRFSAFLDPATRERIPDPQDERTYRESQLNWTETQAEPHASVLRLYRCLLRLRRDEPAMRGARSGFRIEAAGPDGLLVLRTAPDGSALLAVIRLRGSGALDRLNAGRDWSPLVTTEDQPFCSDPQPPRLKPAVEFKRPGAVIFRSGCAAVAEE